MPTSVSVAEATGLAVDEVIDRHVIGEYSVAFCGFSPGFAYMTGLDPVLHLDRRDTPRTRVPAGSVAIAADYTSVYPSPSPGGWHLLGRTDAALWDTERPEPALLAPGTTVRLPTAIDDERRHPCRRNRMVDDDAGPRPRRVRPPRGARGPVPSTRRRTRSSTGWWATRERAATLETAGGLVVEAIGAVVAATSGDGVPTHAAARRSAARRSARRRGLGLPGGARRHPGRAGARLAQPRHAVGRRSAGDPAPASDSTSGDDPHTELVTDLAPVRPRSRVVRLWPGPRVGWFDGGLEALIGHDWHGRERRQSGRRPPVRRALRADGATMPAQMASEGLVTGRSRSRRAGEPIVMLANHPTTGGYPVIAVVDPDDIGERRSGAARHDDPLPPRVTEWG